MKIAVFGVGYVGLVSGTCFAEMGIHVDCVDVNADRIAKLQQGEIPIYEPGLSDLVLENVRAQRLHFTTDTKSALQDAAACFICVGTPMSNDGAANLRYVESVARAIGEHINSQP